MAYDPNKDYSAAIEEAKSAGQDTTQLEAERQEKINAKYGGVEPTMYGSNQTYTQAKSSGNQNDINNAVSTAKAKTSGKASSSNPNGNQYNATVTVNNESAQASGSAPQTVQGSDGRTYTLQGYGVGGTPIYSASGTAKSGYSTAGAMGRNEELAGKTVVANGYTIYYNDLGYATKAVKGETDYMPTYSVDQNVTNGTYSTSGAWTDNETLTASDNEKIKQIRADLAAGKITGDEANAQANAIRAQYGYVIDKNGYVSDYIGQQDYINKINANRAKAGLDPISTDLNTYQKYVNYLMSTDTSGEAQANGSVMTYAEFLAANGLNGYESVTSGGTVQGNSATSVPTGTTTIETYGTTVTPGTGTSASTGGSMNDILNQWYEAAKQQQENSIDYATNQAINELTRAEQDAAAQYQTQRNQIAEDEAKALDNQALYAEARGDKGGIGMAQYNAVQAAAMQNRTSVNNAQVKLSTDTARQISDLRAQGEYEKADALLALAQSYLSQLISLEQWQAEYNLSVAQFNASLEQWAAEYELSKSSITGEYNGQLTYAAQQDQQDRLASAGEVLLAAGIMPSSAQLSAMGLTSAEAQSYITSMQLSSVSSSGGSKSSSYKTTSSTEQKSISSVTFQDMYDAGCRTAADVTQYYIDNFGKLPSNASSIASSFEAQVDADKFGTEVTSSDSGYFGEKQIKAQYEELMNGGQSLATIRILLTDDLNAGDITQDQYNRLIKYFTNKSNGITNYAYK